jgi:hypothetical protein
MRFTKFIFALLILAQSLVIARAQVSCGGQQIGEGCIKVFNSQGALVRSVNLTGVTTNVPVSDLPEGVYHLDIRLNNGEIAHKTFVKIK